MTSPVVEAFRTQVIDTFRAAVPGHAGGLDYRTYLSLPSSDRSGDEAAIVDAIFTASTLRWLGFDISAGEATYNRNRPGVTITRPDYVAHGPIGDAFIWEDKGTAEDFDNEHLGQVRRYMAGQSGYAIWSNSRRILALRFDPSGHFDTVVDISIEALFGPQVALPDEQARNETALELFKLLLERSRFFSFSSLADSIACDETTFLARAVPLDSEQAQREFINGSRVVLQQLHLAALARVQSALAGVDRRHDQERVLWQEWNAARTDLTLALASDILSSIAPRLEGMESRLGSLHASDIVAIENAASSTRPGRLPASQRQAIISWKERVRRINAAIRNLRLEQGDLESLLDAFWAWRERQPDSTIATANVYAEQVAYVFFVRLLLTRVLEDKGLLEARIASDGGFSAWRKLIETYFSSDSEDLHGESFLQLLSDRVSMFYQHFFRQPLYDWFLPDDYLLLNALDFLGKFTFASVGSDLLGFTYEGYIDRVARNRKGHFLTRPQLVEYMLDLLGYAGPQVIGRRLIDPACGSGSFLVHAARRLRAALVVALCMKHGVDEQTLLATSDYRKELAERFVNSVGSDIVGMDIDPFPCYLAELNLFIQCLDDINILWHGSNFKPIDSFMIFNTDSLDLPDAVRNTTITTGLRSLAGMTSSASASLLDTSYQVKALEGQYRQGFYYVLCNPPYVNARQEEITADYREMPFFEEALSGDTNLYLLFLRLGLHLLSTGGSMVFITPLTLLGDNSSSAIRGLLNQREFHTDKLIRFYTGNVLFPGVDQAVAITRVDASGSPPANVEISGGTSVAEARHHSIMVKRQDVLSSVPLEAAWRGVWLVSPDIRAYDVWQQARSVAITSLETLWKGAFGVSQGDTNATHLNPLRVSSPGPSGSGSISLTISRPALAW